MGWIGFGRRRIEEGRKEKTGWRRKNEGIWGFRAL